MLQQSLAFLFLVGNVREEGRAFKLLQDIGGGSHGTKLVNLAKRLEKAEHWISIW